MRCDILEKLNMDKVERHIILAKWMKETIRMKDMKKNKDPYSITLVNATISVTLF